MSKKREQWQNKALLIIDQTNKESIALDHAVIIIINTHKRGIDQRVRLVATCLHKHLKIYRVLCAFHFCSFARTLFARSIIGWMKCVNKKDRTCCGCVLCIAGQRKRKRQGTTTWQCLIRIFDRLYMSVGNSVARLQRVHVRTQTVCCALLCFGRMDWLAMPTNARCFKHSTNILCGTDYKCIQSSRRMQQCTQKWTYIMGYCLRTENLKWKTHRPNNYHILNTP